MPIYISWLSWYTAQKKKKTVQCFIPLLSSFVNDCVFFVAIAFRALCPWPGPPLHSLLPLLPADTPRPLILCREKPPMHFFLWPVLQTVAAQAELFLSIVNTTIAQRFETP